MLKEETVSEVVAKIISETGMPRAAIAKRAGLDPSYLYRILAGKVESTSSMANRLKKAFPKVWPLMSDGVPYYDVDFSTGYTEEYFKMDVAPSMLVQHPFNGMADMWMKNKGNAMSPLIMPDDVLALRDVPIGLVIFGHIYAVVLKEERLIRRVRRSERDGYWRLVPENTEYDAQIVKAEDVLRVFSVDAVSREFNP